MTLSYRIAGRWRRGGLVEQSAALDMSGLPARLVHPDVTATESATSWGAVPLVQRAMPNLIALWERSWLTARMTGLETAG